MNTLFEGYQPYRGEVVMRFTGSRSRPRRA